ncbi:response regulator transcription factor [bacterium AH-315-I20]|nr:response regulator transcription factor [bacterium AH-315-I20]
MSAIKAIIADDEAPLREHLKRLLRKLWPELEICALAENGQQALDAIKTHEPDIAFLDIRMPGISGMDVAKQVADNTHIVFVTAFDQYAVDAFAYHAVDYLLKPVSESRLLETIQRLKENHTNQPQSLDTILQQLAAKQQISTLKWLRIMDGDDVRLLHVDDVAYFKFEHKYTTVRTKDGSYLIRKSLKELEEGLDPELFWRIHRNTIVNVSWVNHAAESDATLTLTLKNIPDELSVSRANKHLFKHM